MISKEIDSGHSPGSNMIIYTNASLISKLTRTATTYISSISMRFGEKSFFWLIIITPIPAPLFSIKRIKYF